MFTHSVLEVFYCKTMCWQSIQQ